MLKVIFITSASHTPSDKNLNHFQRVYFLSRHTELTILARKGADFSVSAQAGTRIVHSPFFGKVGQILYSSLWFIARNGRKMDIVITEPSILGICGFICKLLNGCRWVVDIWDIPIRSTLYNSYIINLRCRVVRTLMKFIYRWADMFIVSIVPDFELRYFRLPNEKMLLLKNAIWVEQQLDEDQFPTNNDNFNILCSRSIHTSDMGLDILTQAYLLLEQKIKNISLTIVGQILEHVKPQVIPLEGLASVRFTGFIERDKLNQLAKLTSVCVIPFKDVPDNAQTYNVKVLEYLSMGKPVVAPNIAGMNGMIEDGVNGLLFKAGDAQDLADKILKLYHDEPLRTFISENAGKLDRIYDCRVKNEVIVQRLNQLVSDVDYVRKSYLVQSYKKKQFQFALDGLKDLLAHNYFLIINYHYFSESNSFSSRFQLTENNFYHQLSYLKKHHSIIPLMDALKMLETNKPFQPKSIVLTFDDCDESFYKIAWPLIREFKIPIHCNIVAGYIGKYCDNGIERNLINYEQIRELLSSGLVTLGSHSLSHRGTTGLNLDDLKKEIIGSKKIIESLQGKCDIFAYPYGGIDTINKDNERMVYEAGYKYALTTIPAFIKPGIDRYRIGRINVTNYDGLFRNILYLKGGIIVLSKGKRLLTSQHFYSNISSGGLIAG